MKTVIITGANGNLGAVTVKKFLQGDYRVIAVARSGSELGFAKDDKNFELHQLDLSDENASLLFAKEAVNMYGNIDAAIFLAGGFAMDNTNTSNLAALQKMIRLNFETAFHLSRVLFQHMLGNDYGRLIFIGAKAALEPAVAEQSLSYALSKSLLFEFAQVLNAQAKGKNVSASVIVPGIIDTATNREAMPGADQSKWVSPEQIAGMLEFICSDAANAVREPVIKLYGNG